MPGTLADGQPIHYGFGLSQLRFGTHRRIVHTGGVSGFGAILEHFPEDKLRIVALANDRSVDVAHELALDLLKVPPPRAVPITWHWWSIRGRHLRRLKSMPRPLPVRDWNCFAAMR